MSGPVGAMLGIGATLALLALVFGMALFGFRNGDSPSDPLVMVRRLTLPEGQSGTRVEVTVTNRDPEGAVVGISLRRCRTPQLLGGQVDYSTALRAVPTAADFFVGVVAGDSITRFRVWRDATDTPDQVLVRVGTLGRLRIHRLPLG